MSNPCEPIRLLLVDDHSLFRKGLRSILEASDSIVVVGEAESGPEAVKRALELSPDVVLMDLQMPGGNGTDAIRELNRHSAQIRILVLTLFEDDSSIQLALRAGAHGYVVKDAEEDVLIRAIHAIAEGGATFSPTVADRVLSMAAIQHPSGKIGGAIPFTEREREILDLLAAGLTNGAIAERLFLSRKTIANNVSEIFDKLDVEDRSAAIVRARTLGFGKNS